MLGAGYGESELWGEVAVANGCDAANWLGFNYSPDHPRPIFFASPESGGITSSSSVCPAITAKFPVPRRQRTAHAQRGCGHQAVDRRSDREPSPATDAVDARGAPIVPQRVRNQDLEAGEEPKEIGGLDLVVGAGKKLGDDRRRGGDGLTVPESPRPEGGRMRSPFAGCTRSRRRCRRSRLLESVRPGRSSRSGRCRASRRDLRPTRHPSSRAPPPWSSERSPACTPPPPRPPSSRGACSVGARLRQRGHGEFVAPGRVANLVEVGVGHDDLQSLTHVMSISYSYGDRESGRFCFRVRGGTVTQLQSRRPWMTSGRRPAPDLPRRTPAAVLGPSALPLPQAAEAAAEGRRCRFPDGTEFRSSKY